MERRHVLEEEHQHQALKELQHSAKHEGAGGPGVTPTAP